MSFRSLTLDELHIDDERSFRHVALYDDLKQVLRRDGYRFRVLVKDPVTWDRVLFLNLTFWAAADEGDVLLSDSLPADVVMHVALHHLTRRKLQRAGASPSARALLLGEAIASAFDLYLVGRLVGHANDSDFLETQLSAMSEVARNAGVSDKAFERMIEGVTADPERAFEDLRELLFDATTTLLTCASVDEAAKVLERFDAHRFGALLHHYELSNWILYARANAHESTSADTLVQTLDAKLRASDNALDWLIKEWL